MSAERLREAAALMRVRAETASPSPWHAHRYIVALGPSEPAEGDVVAGMPGSELDAAYIASMHPAVALAVADWLDATVDRDDFCQATTPANCHVSDCMRHRALAVANAYLGDPA